MNFSSLVYEFKFFNIILSLLKCFKVHADCTYCDCYEHNVDALLAKNLGSSIKILTSWKYTIAFQMTRL